MSPLFKIFFLLIIAGIIAFAWIDMAAVAMEHLIHVPHPAS